MHNSDRNKIRKILKPSGTHYKKKTFLRIFSYSLIICLFILLLTVTVLYFSFSRVVTKEVHNKSIQLLNQTSLVFNTLHAWIIPSFRQIKSESLVNYLILEREPVDLEVSKGLDRLDAVMSSYYLLHSIYIFNKRTGLYYSTLNGIEGTECSDITLPAIVHNIRDFGVYGYIPRKIIYTMNNNNFQASPNEVCTENVFSVIIGDIPDSGSTINGALIVNISESRIREYFLGLNSDASEDLLVVDKNGIVLSHRDEKEFGSDYSDQPYIRKILDSSETEGVFTDKIGGRKYLVSYITNSGPDWRLINIIPCQMLFSNLNSLLKTAVLVFILLMLLALLLTFVGSLRIYSPISKLFRYSQRLKDKSVSAPDKTENISELQAFDRIFRQIVKRVQDADTHLEDYRELSKVEIIRNMLLGEIGQDEISNYTDLVNTVLDRGPYLLAVIRIDNFQALRESVAGEGVSRLFSILKELVFHSLSFPHYFLHMRNECACVILNFQSDADVSMGYITDIFRTLKNGIREKIGHTITIGLGDVFSNIDDISVQYKRVFRTTQYRFSLGHNSVICAGDTAVSEAGKYLLPEEDISSLIRELKLGRMTETEKLLSSVLNSVREYKYEDFTYLRHFMLYRIRKTVEGLRDRLVSSYIKLNELMEDLESLETLADIQKKFTEIFHCMEEGFQDGQNSKTRELAGKTKEYIKSSFQDINLSSESIAEQFGFSTQYIRITFKNIHDISILEYINSLRLDYCRKMLVQTKLPIKKIYRDAGFSNYSYFFTLFKKSAGLTPNRFRLQAK